MKIVKNGKYKVGEGKPCVIVAEIGFNHNGKLSLAKKMVRAAAEAGAHAAKLQTFQADKLVLKNALAYGLKNSRKPVYQADLYRRFELDLNSYKTLSQLSKKLGILFFSTPFDEESADLLESIHVPAYKIASCDVTHHALLRHVARKGKPVIMSCGMATFEEIGQALRVIFKTGNKQVVLLHCISNYPCKPENMNLSRMVALKKKFQVPVGLSDHTDDNYISFAARALGAVLIERHFTLDRKLKGVDHYFSLEPSHLSDLVKGVCAIESAKGKAYTGIFPCERKLAQKARRSLVSKFLITKGDRIRPEFLTAKRPGTGISPKDIGKVLGKIARVPIPAEKILTQSLLS